MIPLAEHQAIVKYPLKIKSGCDFITDNLEIRDDYQVASMQDTIADQKTQVASMQDAIADPSERHAEKEKTPAVTSEDPMIPLAEHQAIVKYPLKIKSGCDFITDNLEIRDDYQVASMQDTIADMKTQVASMQDAIADPSER